MELILASYHDLDDDTKKSLLYNAISTNNEELQQRLLTLRQASGSSLAKLTKEMIKMADSYKVPELSFDEKAAKCRLNFQGWILKLRPILMMFQQTSSVLTSDKVTPFPCPECIGNQALYMFISAKVDRHFQRVIKRYEGLGDKALELLQQQCANVTPIDKHHFHHLFTNTRMAHDESATNFLRRFIIERTQAEAANNTYTDEELVDYILTAMNTTTKTIYVLTIQFFQQARETGHPVSFNSIENKLLSIDEKMAREKASNKVAQGYAVQPAKLNFRGQRKPKASAHVATDKPEPKDMSKVKCYNCNEFGHFANNCPKKKPRDDKKQAHKPYS
jgi:hypothetical protein